MRALRGLALATACLFTPALAHIAAGGSVAPHLEFLVAAALLSTACVALADRRRNATEIAAVLLASQPALHVLMTIGEHGDEATDIVTEPAMLLAHVCAAGLLTVLLSGGESVLWAMAALSTTVLLVRVRRLMDVPLPAGIHRRALALIDHDRVSYAAFVGDAVPDRGPPAVAHP